jgi:L-ascorbate metabolism protein UlaG (beta-lactamase superfamily)
MKGLLPRLAIMLVGLGLPGCSTFIQPDFPSAGISVLPPSPTSPERLAARFFGVTTIHFEQGGIEILIDGFFSRPSLAQTVAGKIGPEDVRIGKALEKGKVGTLSALFVAHSHYDHALDSARVVKRNGGKLMGSGSTANLGRAEGLPADRIRVIYGGQTFAFGDFRVTAYQSPHAPGALFEGGITAPLYPPAHASEYREGGNFSFLIRTKNCAVLVHPSANYLPGLFEGIRVDVMFLSIGKLGEQDAAFIKRYWAETVGMTKPRLVVLTHWDDFFKPLDDGLKPMPRPLDQIDKALKAVGELADKQTAVAFMPLYEPIDIMQVAGGCNASGAR